MRIINLWEKTSIAREIRMIGEKCIFLHAMRDPFISTDGAKFPLHYEGSVRTG
jgi:hypothetical protein